MEEEEEEGPLDPTVLPFLEARTAYELGNTSAIFAEIDMVLAELKDQTSSSAAPVPACPIMPAFDTLMPWSSLLPAIPDMLMPRLPAMPPPPPRRIPVPQPPPPPPPVIRDTDMQSLVFSEDSMVDVQHHPLDTIFQQRSARPKKPRKKYVYTRPKSQDAQLTWHLHSQHHMF